jgi:hypothetical protein
MRLSPFVARRVICCFSLIRCSYAARTSQPHRTRESPSYAKMSILSSPSGAIKSESSLFAGLDTYILRALFINDYITLP